MRISDWSSDVCSSDLRSGGLKTVREGRINVHLVGDVVGRLDEFVVPAQRQRERDDVARPDAVATLHEGAGPERAIDERIGLAVDEFGSRERAAREQAPRDRKSTRMNSSH